MKESYIQDFEAWQKEFTFSIDIEVRFSETDLFGHLNNTVPFIYFEQARIALMKEYELVGANLSPDSPIVPVVADLQCDFLKQIFFGETIQMFAKFAKLGSSSVDIHYMGVVNGEVRLTGRGTLVQMNAHTGRAEKWSMPQIQRIH